MFDHGPMMCIACISKMTESCAVQTQFKLHSQYGWYRYGIR
jgi:hypothetical protein